MIPLAAVTALVSVGVLAAAQSEEPDWRTHDFQWRQPDPAEDEASRTNIGAVECVPPKTYSYAPWADLREGGATVLSDGRLFFGFRVQDFAGATADYAYSIFFTVDGASYQASYYTRFGCANQPGSSRTVTWAECGEIARTGVGSACGTNVFKRGLWFTAHDLVVIEVNIEAIAGLRPGTNISGISFRTYEWFGFLSQGAALRRDVLEPTVEPTQLAYQPQDGTDSEAELTESSQALPAAPAAAFLAFVAAAPLARRR